MKVIKRDIVEPPTQIGNGYTPVLKCNQSRMAVKFSAIQTKIDGRSGKVIEQVPKFLKEGDAGVVKMILTEPMVVETLSEYPPLGRFDVEDKKQTVAVGVIMSVDKGSSDTMAAAKKKVSKLAAKKKGAK